MMAASVSDEPLRYSDNHMGGSGAAPAERRSQGPAISRPFAPGVTEPRLNPKAPPADVGGSGLYLLRPCALRSRGELARTARTAGRGRGG